MLRKWVPLPASQTVRGRYSVGVLKVCPLCGTLNVVESEECFVCSWTGTFDTSPALIDLKVTELVGRCPELAGLLEHTPSSWERARIVWAKWARRLRRRFDIRV